MNLPIKLVTHEAAQKFFVTAYNIPWIKTPVCYLENDKMYVVYDPVNTPVIDTVGDDSTVSVTYIKKPNTFVKDIQNFNVASGTTASYFDYTSSLAETHTIASDANSPTFEERYNFECSDTVAEELISLAVTFALENVESQRLNSKLNMRGIEA